VPRVRIVEYSSPELREPVLIQGLPGLGYVGKISVDFLVEHLNTVHFAELYSNYLTLQDGSLGVDIKSDGKFELPKYDFYAYTDTIPNLILLTGSTQPIRWGQYEVCDEAIRFVERLGCKSVVAIGGYGITQGEDRGSVYAVIDDSFLKDKLQDSSVRITSGGQVTGACGLILGLGRQMGMSCLGLLGATNVNYPDAVAAKSVVKTLATIFGLSLDYAELDNAMADIELKMERFREIRTAAFESIQKPRDSMERGEVDYYV
jgi:proteasome assembly chaperone (PAC2) family protein